MDRKRDYIFCLILLTIASFSLAYDIKVESSLWNCTCELQLQIETNDTVSIADCHDIDLTEIPFPECSAPVTSLDISYNTFMIVHNSAFINYPELEILNLTSCKIGSILPLAFDGLFSLKTIDLSSNEIKFIYPRIFANNRLLETVYLNNNKLFLTLPNIPFLYSQSITTLDLSYCLLELISSEFFSELPKLQSLDLSSNQLAYMSLDVLSHLKNLSTVSIQNNHWMCDLDTLKLMCWVHERSHTANAFKPHKPLLCFTNDGKAQIMWSEMRSSKSCHYFESDAILNNNGEDNSYPWSDYDVEILSNQTASRGWKNNDLLMVIFLTIICIDLFVIIVYIYCFKHKKQENSSNASTVMSQYKTLAAACKNFEICHHDSGTEGKNSQLQSNLKYVNINNE